MAKTVEEILKEEGVIKPLPEEQKGEKIKFEEEIDLRKIIMSIEKLQTEVETFKDIREQNDEKIRELTEKIGEIRSLFFQRESLIKETETKVKMIDDIVSDINPTKFMKELDKKREELLEAQAKIEKLETFEKDINNSIGSMRQTLQNIKSVENLEVLLNEIKDIATKNRETKADIERIAAKTERFYFEMENRIKEVIELKDRFDKLDDFSKELARTVDGINVRLTGFISKADLEDFKKNLNSILASNKEFLNTKIKEIEGFLSLPSEEINTRVEQLKKRRAEVSRLLLSIEEQYKKAFISEKTYNEVRQKNETILTQIEDELNQLHSGQGFSLKSLPDIISKMEGRTNMLERRVEDQKKYVEESLKGIGAESKLSNVTEVVKIQTDMIDDVIKKIKEINDKMSNISAGFGSFELRIKFFEIMDSLVRVDNSRDISYYTNELENLISGMKVNNTWDSRRENLTLNLLSDIANNWRKFGYNEIAKVFDDEVEKIKANKSQVMLKY